MSAEAGAGRSDEVRPRRLALRWLAAALLVAASVHFVLGARGVFDHFTDFPIFLNSVRRFATDGHLYEPVDDLAKYRAGAAIYKYPPLYAISLLPWARRSALEGAHVHFAVQIALYLATAALLVRVVGAGAASPRLFALLAALVALQFGPYFETLQGLQIETPILALLALGLFAVVRGKDAWLGASLGFATVLKVYPAFLLLFLLAQRRWKAVVWFAATAALLVVAGLLVFGFDENWKYFHDVLPCLVGEDPLNTAENGSITRQLQERLGEDPATANRVARLVELPIAAASLLLVWRARRRAASPTERDDPRRHVLPFALSIALMLLCMPNSWLNYQLLLLIPMFVLLRHGLEPRARAAVLVPTLAAFLLLVLSPALPLMQDLGPEREHLLFHLYDVRGAATLVVWAVAFALEWSRSRVAAAGCQISPA